MQEGALPTSTQKFGGTSLRRRDPHPPNLPVPLGKAPKNSNEKTTKTKDVKCFRCLGSRHYASECPTKKIVILKNDEEYTSKSWTNEEDKKEVMEDHLMIIMRLLGSQLKALDQSQRQNIFRIRCYINDKLCYLIVDSESCTNGQV